MNNETALDKNDAKYWEDIKGFVERRFPTEFATNQIKEGITFQQARDAMNLGKLHDALCAGASMDTALRHLVWVGFKECFGIEYPQLEKAYFNGVKPMKAKPVKGLKKAPRKRVK